MSQTFCSAPAQVPYLKWFCSGDGVGRRPRRYIVGRNRPRDSYYYYFMRHFNAVRDSRWKLFVQRTGREGGRRVNVPVTELYDLKADIGETTNVADKHPEVVARLRKLARRRRRISAMGTEANTRPPGFVKSSARYEGTSLPYRFTGRASGDRMSGEVDLGEYGTGLAGAASTEPGWRAWRFS